MMQELSFISFLNHISPIYQFLLSFIVAALITANFYCMYQHCYHLYTEEFLPLNNDSESVSDIANSDEQYCCSLEVGANEWEIIEPLVEKCYQSPVNICKTSINVLERHFCLRWKHYDEVPDKIILKNDGSTIVLTCEYCLHRPSITQIDQLFDEYFFKYIKFRFSLTNADGSEHMIDGRKYPMEIQITHETRLVRNRTKTLILSYFFNIVRHDNSYLNPIIQNLAELDRYNAEAVIEDDVFPLSWILPKFETGYFSYTGSLTEPPYTENMFWIIQPEPLAVSERQMQYFRRMLINKCFISFHNSRSVQNLNMRNIFYNIPQRCRENINYL